MVPMAPFVSFDPAELGVKENVRYLVLRQLLEQFGDDEEALKEAITDNIDVLIPKHVIVDDVFASVNYLNCLACGVGVADDTLLFQRICRLLPQHLRHALLRHRRIQ